MSSDLPISSGFFKEGLGLHPLLTVKQTGYDVWGRDAWSMAANSSSLSSQVSASAFSCT